MSVAIGSTVAHFKITAKIGEGGMGEVYRATDTKLGREVALKVLPEEMASDPERLSRFQREAKTVAALNHPNIITIFSVDEADGLHFLTMELVAGKPLSKLMPAGGFSLDRLFALAIPIADAVASAHSRGIVHRDLKPENVMIDGEERAKVLDFGLAKATEAPIRADGRTETMPLTEDGRVMGTVPYMAPEQIQGKPVDARSDIFSLGVMLYEMAAGQRPFVGETSAEVMAAIQRDNAEALAVVRSDLPRHLGRIVQHCLEKHPDRRFQSALDVRNELEQLQREVGSDSPPSGAASGATVPVDSGLALKTLLVTDLEASTRMVEALGDERTAEIMAAHDRMVRDLVVSCGGREIDKTDGFLLLFDRPLDAVRFAVLYHRRLAGLGSDENLELRARAGIHLGEVVLRLNPPRDVARGAKPLEVEGLAKPTAARLMSLAQGGQTLLSQGAFDLARRAAVGKGEELGKLRWQSHGTYRMKGVEEPIRVFEVREEALAPLGLPPMSDKVTRTAADSLLGEINPLSIAVLPFGNLSPDPENAFFADGMTEEIISRLSQIGALTVLSRTSVMRYKDTGKEPRRIGQELRASNILEGSVRRAGGQVRITGQLIDGASGRHLWSQSYQRKLDDIFAIQSEVAEQIASALEVELSSAEQEILAKRPTANLTAYDFYLKGLHFYHRYTKLDNEISIELYGKALAEDPDFALAVAGRADAYSQRSARYGFPYREWMEASLREAKRAAELDPELAEAHKALGLAYGGTGFHIKAIENYLKALELRPNYATAVNNIGGQYDVLGQTDESLFRLKKAVTLDPLSSFYNANVAAAYTALGMDGVAENWYQRALELEPNSIHARGALSLLLFFQGETDRLLNLAQEILTISPGEPLGTSMVGWASWLAGNDAKAEEFFRNALEFNRIALAQITWKDGRQEESKALLAPVLENLESRLEQGTATWETYSDLARIHALRGEKEEAYRRLGQSVEAGAWPYRRFLREPCFEKMRGEARFRELMSCIEVRVDEMRQRVEAREAST